MDQQDSETEIWVFFLSYVKNPTVLLKVKGFPALVALSVCRSIASFLSPVVSRVGGSPSLALSDYHVWSHQGWFAFVEQLFNSCLVWGGGGGLFFFKNKYSTRRGMRTRGNCLFLGCPVSALFRLLYFRVFPLLERKPRKKAILCLGE